MTVIEYCWGGHLKGTLGSMQKEKMKELGEGVLWKPNGRGTDQQWDLGFRPDEVYA